jgi:hypothetical protein
VLLCSNCHRGVHAGHLKIPDNYESFFSEERANELLEENYKIKHGELHYCQRCGKIIPTRDAKHCVECSKLVSRLVDRPEREELKQLIRELPFTQIGAKFGVTDNAIRKWCDAYNLPRKKKDISAYSDEEWARI